MRFRVLASILLAFVLLLSISSNVTADALDGDLWISVAGDNSVRRFSAPDFSSAVIPVGDGPRGVAVGDPYVWVANENGDTVTRIAKADLSTTPISVGNGPSGVAVDDTYVWATNRNDNTVTRITKSDLSTTDIAVGASPYGIAVDLTHVWVANSNDDTVTRITKSDSSTATIAVGGNPYGITVDGTHVWVANRSDDTVTRITKSDSSTTDIPVGDFPCGVTVDDTHVWVANLMDRTLTRIDKSNLSTTATPDLGGETYGVSVDDTHVCVTLASGIVGQMWVRIAKSNFLDIAYYPVPFNVSIGDMTGYGHDNFAVANAAPIAVDDTASTAEEAPVTIDVLDNDTDANSDPLNVADFDAASANGGTITDDGGGALVYTPAENFHGSDNFTYDVSDGLGGTDSATVTITVTPVNDTPAAQSQTVSMVEDSQDNGITLAGSDVDGDSLTFTVTMGPFNGTLTGTAPDLLYTPAIGYIGTDVLFFTVNDGTLDSTLGTVELSVTEETDIVDAGNSGGGSSGGGCFISTIADY